MKTSESISNLSAAMLAAQKSITFATKDAKNPQFKSTYADISSVIEAIKPAFNAAGITFIQMFEQSEPGMIAMSTRLLHESGEWIESTATCPMQKSDPQGYGSACTYLRRYSLAAVAGLYQEDDDGNAASKPRPAPAAVLDMSPAARAGRIESGVIGGDTAGAAQAMAGWDDKTRDAVWALLKPETQQKLTAEWPQG